MEFRLYAVCSNLIQILYLCTLSCIAETGIYLMHLNWMKMPIFVAAFVPLVSWSPKAVNQSQWQVYCTCSGGESPWKAGRSEVLKGGSVCSHRVICLHIKISQDAESWESLENRSEAAADSHVGIHICTYTCEPPRKELSPLQKHKFFNFKWKQKSLKYLNIYPFIVWVARTPLSISNS